MKIAELEKHEERFNEEFHSLNERYHACMQRLDTKEQENDDLEGQIKHLQEINAGHLTQIQRLEDLATRKPPETPQGGEKCPCFDIKAIEQRHPSSEYFYVLAERTRKGDNASMGSDYSIDSGPGERMDVILRDELGSDIEPENMELNSYSTRSRTPSVERHERRSSIKFRSDREPYGEKGKESKIRSRSVDGTKNMPRSTAGAPVDPQPSHQANIDATEAKDLEGAARRRAVMPECELTNSEVGSGS